MKRICDKQVRVYVMEFSVAPHVVYVGATENPLELRKAQHTVAAFHRRRSRPVFNQVRETIEAGGVVDIRELAAVPPYGDWEDVERFYIASFRALGLKVLNVSDGGAGGVPHFGRKMTEANKKLLADSQRRPEVRAKKSAAMKARWLAKKTTP